MSSARWRRNGIAGDPAFAQILTLFSRRCEGVARDDLPPQLAALSVTVISWPGSLVLGVPV